MIAAILSRLTSIFNITSWIANGPAIQIIYQIYYWRRLHSLLGRLQEAESSLRWLRGSDYNIKAELCRIEAQVVQDAAQKPCFSDLMRPGLYKPVLIGIGLMIFQQSCGINAALFNSVEIFRLSGSSLDGLVSAVILNVILVGPSLKSIFFPPIS